MEIKNLKEIITEKIKEGYVYIDGASSDDFIKDNFPIYLFKKGDVLKLITPNNIKLDDCEFFFLVRKTDNLRKNFPDLNDDQFGNLKAIIVENKKGKNYKTKVIGSHDEKSADKIIDAIIKSIDIRENCA